MLITNVRRFVDSLNWQLISKISNKVKTSSNVEWGIHFKNCYNHYTSHYLWILIISIKTLIYLIVRLLSLDLAMIFSIIYMTVLWLPTNLKRFPNVKSIFSNGREVWFKDESKKYKRAWIGYTLYVGCE